MTLSESIIISNRSNILLFAFPIDQNIDYYDNFMNMLSPDELKNAKEFNYSEDEKRFVMSRGFLRFALSACINISPIKIRFSKSENGKPSLCYEHDFLSLKFNISHSKNVVILGITKGQEVGVDIEFVERFDGIMEIVRNYASEIDREHILSYANNDQEIAFYRWWTKAEASLKCTGVGLSYLQKISAVDFQFFTGDYSVSDQLYIIAVCVKSIGQEGNYVNIALNKVEGTAGDICKKISGYWECIDSNLISSS